VAKVNISNNLLPVHLNFIDPFGNAAGKQVSGAFTGRKRHALRRNNGIINGLKGTFCAIRQE
jgi:hypothetical protein